MATFNCKYKTANFDVLETSEERGSRLVTHEYPGRDTPYTENLGRKARKYQLKAVVAGTDWKTKRDELIRVFEDSKPGTLKHPSYGELYCYCETASISETYVNGRGQCTFDLTFIEQQRARGSASRINTQEVIRSSGQDSITKLQKAFQLLYKIKNLPTYAADFLSNKIELITGASPFQILSAISTAKGLLNTNLGDSLLVASGLSQFMGSYRSSFLSWFESSEVDPTTYNQVVSPAYNNKKHVLTITDSTGNLTQYVTPGQCIATHTAIKNAILNQTPLSGTTINKNQSREQMNVIDGYILALCALEQAIASTYLNFNDIVEARIIWVEVLDTFDTAYKYLADGNAQDMCDIIKSEKANYQLDITARAPTINKVVKKLQTTIQPALTVVYQQYGDITRYDDFIERNSHIDNPAEVFGNLEFTA